MESRRLRDDFPILSQTVNGRRLVYLDNAASAQKPSAVLDAMRDAYELHYANVHRGVHTLSQRSTEAFEAARRKVADFINARRAAEIGFVRGATEAINLVASTFGRKMLRAGDEIVLSQLEHHSNIVPWQLLRDEKQIVLKVAPIDDEGNFLLERFADLLSPRTKLVAITASAFGRFLAAMYARGKVVATICSGASALLGARNDDGSWPFVGKRITGFPISEKIDFGVAEAAPWLLESRLTEAGAAYTQVEKHKVHLEVDGNLVTGQNGASARETAAAVIETVREKTRAVEPASAR